MDILADLKLIVDPNQFKILLYLVMANIGSGTIAALAQGRFELVKLMEHWKRVGLILGAYLVVGVATRGVSDFAPLMTLTWATLIAALGSYILVNLKELGLPVPDSFLDLVKRNRTPPPPPGGAPSP